MRALLKAPVERDETGSRGRTTGRLAYGARSWNADNRGTRANRPEHVRLVGR
jgi:hypothetical protein